MRWYTKNFQSLQTEERFAEILEELRLAEWDFLFGTETWREDDQEVVDLPDGHMFVGAGGMKGSRGVGIFIHERWKGGFEAFRAINERVGVLDIKVAGIALRLIVVYMPHINYSDKEVDAVYDEVSRERRDAAKHGRRVAVGGDFNAVVGQRGEGGDPAVVGPHGIGRRNARGDMLVWWATMEDLCIVNTKFRKQFEYQWTHNNGINKRQIDYFCFDMTLGRKVTNSEANDGLNVGKDHRCVRVDVKMKVGGSRKAPFNPRKKHTTWGWQPVDRGSYVRDLEGKLEQKFGGKGERDGQRGERCKALEALVVEVAKNHQEVKPQAEEEQSSLGEEVRQLIVERKKLKAGDRAENEEQIKGISKAIQKKLKLHIRTRKRAQVRRVLGEFRGLRQLADIRNNHVKKRLGSVLDMSGKLQSSRQGVVDAFAEFYADLYECKVAGPVVALSLIHI